MRVGGWGVRGAGGTLEGSSQRAGGEGCAQASKHCRPTLLLRMSRSMAGVRLGLPAPITPSASVVPGAGAGVWSESESLPPLAPCWIGGGFEAGGFGVRAEEDRRQVHFMKAAPSWAAQCSGTTLAG